MASCNCSGGCAGACFNSCKGCTGGCSGCGSGCASGCSGCTATCADNCSGKCNSQCTGGANTATVNLTLSDLIENSNMDDIAKAIYYEAGSNRRKKSPVSVTFTEGDHITAADITTVINNLSKAGQTISYTATVGQSSLKVLGQALIDKVKIAYDQTIKGA